MTASFLSDLKGTIDIKLQVQASVRLITEVVSQTAYPYPFVITLFIEHAMVIRSGIRHSEVSIAESNEDHWHAIGFLGVKVIRHWKHLVIPTRR